MGRGISRIVLAAVAAATTLALATAVAGAQSGGNGCADTQSPCVMLIQVDGLEATDVTQEKTPFLWALAHPTGSTNQPAAGLGSRNGWIWQAPRAAMTAGLAANTASMLTGGYPEQTGVAGDEIFRVEGEGGQSGGTLPTYKPKSEVHQAAESDPGDIETLGGTELMGPGSYGEGVQSILELNQTEGDGKTAAYIGDPDLAGFAEMDPSDLGSPPTTPPEGNSDTRWTPRIRSQDAPPNDLGGNPAFCDTPRNPSPVPGTAVASHEGNYLKACAAKDEVTLQAAAVGLATEEGLESNLTYIELAELGHIKRTAPSNAALDSALNQLDSNIGFFLNRLAQNPSQEVKDNWAETIVFVVGSGGYEDTPLTDRVPDPNTPTQDLAHFVAHFDGTKLALAQQGTVATVYSTQDGWEAGETADNPTQAHKNRIQALKTAIEGEVSAACGSCIAEVLYMRPNLAPADKQNQTVDAQHPSWHIDHTYFDINRDTFEEARVRTGSSGDLLIVTKPGWATGKSEPTPQEILAPEPDSPITNPYQASTGGPRNRSMAAIVNGPACTGQKCVFNLASKDSRGAASGGYYPVATTAEGTPDSPACAGTAPVAAGGVAAANANPGDDANEAGHECQAEIVDVGPTISAVLGLRVPFQQIGGRLLHEAINGLPEITERPSQILPEAFLVAGPLAAAEGDAYPTIFEGTTTFGFVAQPDKPEVPTFECQLVPGEVAPSAMPEGGWSACGDPPETLPDLCQAPRDPDGDGVPELGEDGQPIVEPFPCSSLHVEGLAPGQYTFSVRAAIKAGSPGPSERSTGTFVVAEPPTIDVLPPPYNCPKVICPKAKAYVSNSKGKPADEVKKGTLLNNVTFKAGFGMKFTAVDLTFYRAEREGSKKSLRGKGGGGKKELTAIADFEPFVLPLEQDAIAKLGFEVPPDYQPTHLGVDLQTLKRRDLTEKEKEACRTKSDDPLCLYKPKKVCKGKNNKHCFADIFRIEDAGMLHEKAKGKCKGKNCKGKGEGGKGPKLSRIDVPILRGAMRFG